MTFKDSRSCGCRILAAIKGIDGDVKDQRIVLFGAGSAGIGIAELITQAMMEQGMSREEAKERIFVMGRNGLRAYPYPRSR
ncbi:MAG: hypothetical protein H7A38_03455 [Chlamydiales bacterium]|nr:hypothetical protein [Chlamydiales bacterium]